MPQCKYTQPDWYCELEDGHSGPHTMQVFTQNALQEKEKLTISIERGNSPEIMTPLEVLIKAKLAGTSSPSSVPMHYEYIFRSNEQAAELALRALEQAGYKITPIRRLIIENYNTYVCEKCGTQRIVVHESTKPLDKLRNVVPCLELGCQGEAYILSEAEKLHQESINSQDPQPGEALLNLLVDERTQKP